MIERRSVRFWAWVNGSPVKLTMNLLRRRLSWWKEWKTEEGYSFEAVEYELTRDGKTILRHSTSGGQDCDGPIRFYETAMCEVDHLAACVPSPKTCSADYDPDLRYPYWQRVKSETFDLYARRAGY